MSPFPIFWIFSVDLAVSQGAEVSIPEEWIERRVKWEQNPTFPPADAHEETLAKWRIMVPAERRKMLMMHEIEHFTAVTTVSHVA